MNETAVINPEFAHLLCVQMSKFDPLRITLRLHTVTYVTVCSQLLGLLCSQITSVPSNSSFQRLPSIDTAYNPEVSKHQAVYLRISYLDFLRNLWPSKHKAWLGYLLKSKCNWITLQTSPIHSSLNLKPIHSFIFLTIFSSCTVLRELEPLAADI